jgi:hypothetical protein
MDIEICLELGTVVPEDVLALRPVQTQIGPSGGPFKDGYNNIAQVFIRNRRVFVT